MNYTQQSLYNYIVHNTSTPRNSIRPTLGEHLNPDIIVTFESKYSQRTDVTLSYMAKVYGFSVDTYRNYYTAYCELRDEEMVTSEDLAAPPFYFEATVPNLELPSTPQEVIDLRMQVANQANQIHLLEQQLVQYNNISNKLELILNNQDTMQRTIAQQVMQSKSHVNETFTSSYDKHKEALQYVQEYFVTLVDSCRDTVSAFQKLKGIVTFQGDEVNTFQKELRHLIEIVEVLERKINATN